MPCGAWAADTLNLYEAVAQNKIRVLPQGQGGLGAEAALLTLHNNTLRPLCVVLPVGLYFSSIDPEVQDLLTLQEEVLTLAANQSATAKLYGACTQMPLISPQSGEAYQLKLSPDSALQRLAGQIVAVGLEETIGQSAVWAYTDRSGVQYIYDPDAIHQSWTVATLVAELNGQTPPTRESFEMGKGRVRPTIFTARVDLVYHSPTQNMAKLEIYNGSGELVKTCFDYKPLSAGLHFYTLGLNRIVDRDTVSYVAQLTDREGHVLQTMPLVNNQPYVAAKEKVQKIQFEFIVRQPDFIDMEVYDENDRLVEVIYLNKHFPITKRNTRFTFIHAFEKGTTYSIKLIDSKGQVIHSEPVVAN
ncbi:hypothetical protein BFP72_06790 [Reichenbachiella sp. 5M10]|nr:hypothetical protein BFP72_06790 [Reichenbachiella sp. 5M10]